MRNGEKIVFRYEGLDMSKDSWRGKIRIGVIGGSDASFVTLKEAEETGRLIAEEGCILVTGGLGGVMEAASRGAKEEMGWL